MECTFESTTWPLLEWILTFDKGVGIPETYEFQMLDLSEPPAVSRTNIASLLVGLSLWMLQGRILFCHGAISYMHCHLHMTSLTSLKNTSTFPYYLSRLSFEHALALWMLRCWGFPYLRSRHFCRKHCHQSNPRVTKESVTLWEELF